MYLHWSNRQHLDQANAGFAPYHYFGSALRKFLLSDPLENIGMLRSRRLQRYNILIDLFRRTAK